ncbi:MAG TPA: L,D-transpeptidase family protein [Ilumatobacteraceae bacterium]|nr:L,D-transpeptidase family protein [Ilumatobacteraceae bacterium]
MPASQRDREARIAVIVVLATAIGLIVIALSGRGSETDAASSDGVQSLAAAVATESTVSAATSDAATDAAAATDPAGSTPTSEPLPDLDVVDDATSAELTNAEQSSGDGCTMTVLSLRHGESGESVSCLQGALAAAGYYTGTVSGQFDQATYDAVKKVQEERNLYVDGVVGRETALSLEIWPEEESLVTRTPPPAPGAVDAWGYALSSVASTGDGAPPVPANSGSGRRVVYERAGQRVWAIDKDENVIRSWLVSGSQYTNEVPGTHQVYSKSEVSTAWNGKAFLPLMVRWYQTDIGHLGFHAIPIHRSDNTPYQTEAELGTRLSGGCQRQANRDAQFMWDFADIGTTVVVL